MYYNSKLTTLFIFNRLVSNATRLIIDSRQHLVVLSVKVNDLISQSDLIKWLEEFRLSNGVLVYKGYYVKVGPFRFKGNAPVNLKSKNVLTKEVHGL